jgi:hypothetical protein
MIEPVPTAPAAQALGCRRCGGVMPLQGLARRVRCPYCAFDQDVPPQQLAALAQYQSAAGQLVASLKDERNQRAQWETWYRPDGTARGGPLAAFAIFGSIVAVYAVAMLLRSEQLIDDATLERALPPAILGTFFLGMGFVIARSVSRRRAANSAAPAALAQCPRCGGSLPFQAGRVSERCVHCGAALVVAPAVMQRAIEAARADLRAAAMARHRLERRAMEGAYRRSASPVLPYVVLGSFLPMTAGAAVAFTVDRLTNARSDTPAAGLAVLWLLALANGGAIALVMHLRAARRRRWRAVADGLAARLTGRVSSTGTDWVAWLNTMWAGPYALTSLLLGPCFHAVTGSVGGFAVAVDLDPILASSGHGAPRADVLLAARLPGDVQAVAAPPDLAQRAIGRGFSLSSSTAGLVASGGGALPGLAKNAPDEAAETLADMARLLAEWAGRAGAEAALPAP